MFETILVPTDGSPGASSAASKAIELAADCSATVHVLSVVELPGQSSGAAFDHLNRLAKQAVEVCRRRGDEAGVTVETAIRQGRPYEEILGYGEQIDADVIVMGTRGHNGLERLLLGSVTQRVIQTGDIPVLSVQPDPDAQEISDEAAAIQRARSMLQNEGYESMDLREDPYLERALWVVPMTGDGDAVNVYIERHTGHARVGHNPSS